MSVHSNVTKECMIGLTNLSEQEKKQSAIKNENKILNQSLDEELAETFEPIATNKEVNESNKILKRILKKQILTMKHAFFIFTKLRCNCHTIT